jgi:hypothetical protein
MLSSEIVHSVGVALGRVKGRELRAFWTEGRAVWNKGAAGVLAATREVEERLPFALLGFDSDNGGEFLNHHLWSSMRERQAAVEFTRSRP